MVTGSELWERCDRCHQVYSSEFSVDCACEPDYDYDGDERDEPQLSCIACCCIIGDEVAYGDDWGEGPLCTRCAGMEPET